MIPWNIIMLFGELSRSHLACAHALVLRFKNMLCLVSFLAPDCFPLKNLVDLILHVPMLWC